jgi:hypothetical protein
VITVHRLTIVQAITDEIIRQLADDKELDVLSITDQEDKEIAKLINQTVKIIKDRH